MYAAEAGTERHLSDRPDGQKLQDILSSQPHSQQGPPGFAPGEPSAPSKRRNRLQRELVVGPLNFLLIPLILRSKCMRCHNETHASCRSFEGSAHRRH